MGTLRRGRVGWWRQGGLEAGWGGKGAIELNSILASEPYPASPRLSWTRLMGKQAVKIDFATVRTEDLIFRIVTPYLIGQKYPILA